MFRLVAHRSIRRAADSQYCQAMPARDRQRLSRTVARRERPGPTANLELPQQVGLILVEAAAAAALVGSATDSPPANPSTGPVWQSGRPSERATHSVHGTSAGQLLYRRQDQSSAPSPTGQ